MTKGIDWSLIKVHEKPLKKFLKEKTKSKELKRNLSDSKEAIDTSASESDGHFLVSEQDWYRISKE
jgi:hypothetical protein